MVTILQQNKFNQSGHDLATVSGRLNALWDFAGYPPIHKNRTVEIQASLELGATSAKNYVLYNYLPKRPVLILIVEDALSRIPNGRNYKEGAVRAWIENGEESGCPCPFVERDTSSIEHVSTIVTAAIAYRAQAEGINLKSIPAETLGEIAGQVAAKIKDASYIEDFSQLRKSDIAIIDGLLWAAVGS